MMRLEPVMYENLIPMEEKFKMDDAKLNSK